MCSSARARQRREPRGLVTDRLYSNRTDELPSPTTVYDIHAGIRESGLFVYMCVYLRVSATLVTCVDNVVSEGHNIVDR